jgi:hypothetical protein
MFLYNFILKSAKPITAILLFMLMKVIANILLIVTLAICINTNLLLTYRDFKMMHNTNAFFEWYQKTYSKIRGESVINCYGQLTGMDGGYGFFSPGVSDECNMTFVLKYPQSDSICPLPLNSTAGIRRFHVMSNFFNNNHMYRDTIARSLASYIMEQHPNAKAVKVFAYYSPMLAYSDYLQKPNIPIITPIISYTFTNNNPPTK